MTHGEYSDDTGRMVNGSVRHRAFHCLCCRQHIRITQTCWLEHRRNDADTQSAKLVKECRDLMRQIASPQAVCLSFGWNTNGMGKKRGYEPIEIMIVDHGGSHNATLCLAEKRLPEEKELDFGKYEPCAGKE